MKIFLRRFVPISLIAFLFISHTGFASTVSDALITTQVKAKLMAPQYQKITVETNDGVVSLGGQVASQTQAVEAVKIAESVPQVIDVDPTFLQTPPSGQPIKDSYITAKVQGVIVQHNLISKGEYIPLENMNIEVKNGIVYLSGLVSTNNQIKQSIKLAQSVKGAVKVESSLHTH